MHYTCIAYLTIDSIMEIDKKYFLQVYLEECKYKVKKRQIEIESQNMILSLKFVDFRQV